MRNSSEDEYSDQTDNSSETRNSSEDESSDEVDSSENSDFVQYDAQIHARLPSGRRSLDPEATLVVPGRTLKGLAAAAVSEGLN